MVVVGISKYMLHLVGVLEVGWNIAGSGKRTAFCGQWNENHHLHTSFFFVHKKILSSVQRLEFVNHRMS
jgi:hypothetical protein